jgi:hypothetical protein
VLEPVGYEVADPTALDPLMIVPRVSHARVSPPGKAWGVLVERGRDAAVVESSIGPKWWTPPPVFGVATQSNPENPTLLSFQEATGRPKKTISAPFSPREA